MPEIVDIQAIDRQGRKAAVASQPVHSAIDKAARHKAGSPPDRIHLIHSGHDTNQPPWTPKTP